MKAPVHRNADKHLFTAAEDAILAYLRTRSEGATLEDLRDNLTAKCRGLRYLSSAIKTLRARDEVVMSRRRWFAGRKAT